MRRFFPTATCAYWSRLENAPSALSLPSPRPSMCLWVEAVGKTRQGRWREDIPINEMLSGVLNTIGRLFLHLFSLSRRCQLSKCQGLSTVFWGPRAGVFPVCELRWLQIAQRLVGSKSAMLASVCCVNKQLIAGFHIMAIIISL